MFKMKLFLLFVMCVTQIQLCASAVEQKDEFKVLCYFQSSSGRRTGGARYIPENIDERLCTHIIYAFANLDNSTLKIIPKDRQTDIDNRYYEQVTALRQKGIKVMIALGGWNDCAGDKYSRLLANQSARSVFVDSVVEFIETKNFDGLDLDLEYPTCWQGECRNGNHTEKETFSKLIEELSHKFRRHGWILSAAVSSSKGIIDKAYDIPKLNHHLDWIGLMTYDYHGHWKKHTGHSAPLYYRSGDISVTSNVNFTAHYLIQSGASPRKIVIGIPFYGRSFTLSNVSNYGLYASTVGPGESGTYIRSKGVLHLCDICNKTKNYSWNVERDTANRIGIYAYKDNQWVSYDDLDTLQAKAIYVRHMNLGGVMVWSMDLDDYKGDCGCGNYPLLKALNHELRKRIGCGTKVERCT